MTNSSQNFQTRLSPQECVETFKQAIHKRPLGLNLAPLKFFTPQVDVIDDQVWDYRIGVSFRSATVEMACRSTDHETIVSLSGVGPLLEALAFAFWQHVLRAFNEADPSIDISQDHDPDHRDGYEGDEDAQVIQLPVSEPVDSGDAFIDYVRSADFAMVPQTWVGLRSQILEFGHRSPDTVIDDDEVHSFLALTITAPSGRSQTVMISHFEEDEAVDWLRIESAVGPYDPKIAVAAIDYVALRENWSVGVARVADHLYLRWTGMIGMNTLQNILNMIDGVAGKADRLEAALSEGADEY